MGKKSAFGAMSDADRVEFGDRVSRVVREFRTQARAAEVADLSVDQLVRIMQGKSAPTAIAIARLAMEAGYDINWIVTGVGDPRMDWPSYEGARAVLAHPVTQLRVQIQQLEQQRALGDAVGGIYQASGYKLSSNESAEVCGMAIDALTESGVSEDQWTAVAATIARCHKDAVAFIRKVRR